MVHLKRVPVRLNHRRLISLLVTGVVIVPSLLILSDISVRIRVTSLSPKTRQSMVSNVSPKERHLDSKDLAFTGQLVLTSADLIEDLGSKAVNATDPRLLRLLREKWLLAPSSRPYDLKNPEKEHTSQIGQSQTVDKLLKQRQNGFFVEAGAANGESHSNSLFFERFRNWTGVLVEADPWAFYKITKKHRKSYIINTCLSPRPHPERMEFTYASELGGIGETGHVLPDYAQDAIRGKGFPQCFPIHSILAALGVTHVDYFSLDVEGAEVEILRSFPWEEITVDVWTVEYGVFGSGGGGDTQKRLKGIREIFQKTGLYREVKFRKTQDVLFARREVLI